MPESQQMRLRLGLILVVLLTACRPAPRTGESLLPATVANLWQRKSLRAISPSPAGARNAFEASYEGPGRLTADVYGLNSTEQGLDLAQRWKPAVNTVFFYSGRYFVVIKWEQADRAALQAFTTALEKLGRTQ